MTLTQITSSHANRFGTGEHPSLWAGFGQALENYKTYRRTLRELRALTEQQLGDLGMCRDTLRGTAHRAVYGD